MIELRRPPFGNDTVFLWLETDMETHEPSVKLMSSVNGVISLEGRFYPNGTAYLTDVGYFKVWK